MILLQPSHGRSNAARQENAWETTVVVASPVCAPASVERCIVTTNGTQRAGGSVVLGIIVQYNSIVYVQVLYCSNWSIHFLGLHEWRMKGVNWDFPRS